MISVCLCLLYISGWLQAVEGDDTKAYCSYCEVNIRAHYGDLERHSHTEKHKKRLCAVKKESNSSNNTGTLYIG